MGVTVGIKADTAGLSLSAHRGVLGTMTSAASSPADFSHPGPQWVSVFLDTLVLSNGQVLAEGIFGPEHLRQALADHGLRAAGDPDELLDGSIDALPVLPATGASS